MEAVQAGPDAVTVQSSQASPAADASSSGEGISTVGISTALDELLDRCQHEAEVLTAAGELLGKARVTLEQDVGEAAATGLDQVLAGLDDVLMCLAELQLQQEGKGSCASALEKASICMQQLQGSLSVGTNTGQHKLAAEAQSAWRQSWAGLRRDRAGVAAVHKAVSDLLGLAGSDACWNGGAVHEAMELMQQARTQLAGTLQQQCCDLEATCPHISSCFDALMTHCRAYASTSSDGSSSMAGTAGSQPRDGSPARCRPSSRLSRMATPSPPPISPRAADSCAGVSSSAPGAAPAPSCLAAAAAWPSTACASAAEPQEQQLPSPWQGICFEEQAAPSSKAEVELPSTGPVGAAASADAAAAVPVVLAEMPNHEPCSANSLCSSGAGLLQQDWQGQLQRLQQQLQDSDAASAEQLQAATQALLQLSQQLQQERQAMQAAALAGAAAASQPGSLFSSPLPPKGNMRRWSNPVFSACGAEQVEQGPSMQPLLSCTGLALDLSAVHTNLAFRRTDGSSRGGCKDDPDSLPVWSSMPCAAADAQGAALAAEITGGERALSPGSAVDGMQESAAAVGCMQACADSGVQAYPRRCSALHPRSVFLEDLDSEEALSPHSTSQPPMQPSRLPPCEPQDSLTFVPAWSAAQAKTGWEQLGTAGRARAGAAAVQGSKAAMKAVLLPGVFRGMDDCSHPPLAVYAVGDGGVAPCEPLADGVCTMPSSKPRLPTKLEGSPQHMGAVPAGKGMAAQDLLLQQLQDSVLGSSLQQLLLTLQHAGSTLGPAALAAVKSSNLSNKDVAVAQAAACKCMEGATLLQEQMQDLMHLVLTQQQQGTAAAAFRAAAADLAAGDVQAAAAASGQLRLLQDMPGSCQGSGAWTIAAVYTGHGSHRSSEGDDEVHSSRFVTRSSGGGMEYTHVQDVAAGVQTAGGVHASEAAAASEDPVSADAGSAGACTMDLPVGGDVCCSSAGDAAMGPPSAAVQGRLPSLDLFAAADDALAGSLLEGDCSGLLFDGATAATMFQGNDVCLSAQAAAGPEAAEQQQRETTAHADAAVLLAGPWLQQGQQQQEQCFARSSEHAAGLPAVRAHALPARPQSAPGAVQAPAGRHHRHASVSLSSHAEVLSLVDEPEDSPRQQHLSCIPFPWHMRKVIKAAKKQLHHPHPAGRPTEDVLPGLSRQESDASVQQQVMLVWSLRDQLAAAELKLKQHQEQQEQDSSGGAAAAPVGRRARAATCDEVSLSPAGQLRSSSGNAVAAAKARRNTCDSAVLGRSSLQQALAQQAQALKAFIASTSRPGSPSKVAGSVQADGRVIIEPAQAAVELEQQQAETAADTGPTEPAEQAVLLQQPQAADAQPDAAATIEQVASILQEAHSGCQQDSHSSSQAGGSGTAAQTVPLAAAAVADEEAAALSELKSKVDAYQGLTDPPVQLVLEIYRAHKAWNATRLAAATKAAAEKAACCDDLTAQLAQLQQQKALLEEQLAASQARVQQQQQEVLQAASQQAAESERAAQQQLEAAHAEMQGLSELLSAHEVLLQRLQEAATEAMQEPAACSADPAPAHVSAAALSASERELLSLHEALLLRLQEAAAAAAEAEQQAAHSAGLNAPQPAAAEPLKAQDAEPAAPAASIPSPPGPVPPPAAAAAASLEASTAAAVDPAGQLQAKYNDQVIQQLAGEVGRLQAEQAAAEALRTQLTASSESHAALQAEVDAQSQRLAEAADQQEQSAQQLAGEVGRLQHEQAAAEVLRTQLAAASERNAALQAEVEALSQRLGEAASQQQQQAVAEALQAQLAAATEHNAALQAEVTALSQRLDEAADQQEQSAQQLAGEVGRLQAEKAAAEVLRTQLAAASECNAALQAEAAALSQQLAEAASQQQQQAAAEVLQAQLVAASQRNAALQAEVEALSQRLVEAASQQQQQAAAEALEAQLAAASEHSTALQAEVDALSQQLVDAAGQHEQVTQQIVAEVAALDGRLQQEQAAAEALRTQLAAASERNAALQAEVDALSQRLAEIAQQQEAASAAVSLGSPQVSISRQTDPAEGLVCGPAGQRCSEPGDDAIQHAKPLQQFEHAAEVIARQQLKDATAAAEAAAARVHQLQLELAAMQECNADLRAQLQRMAGTLTELEAATVCTDGVHEWPPCSQAASTLDRVPHQQQRQVRRSLSDSLLLDAVAQAELVQGLSDAFNRQAELQDLLQQRDKQLQELRAQLCSSQASAAGATTTDAAAAPTPVLTLLQQLQAGVAERAAAASGSTLTQEVAALLARSPQKPAEPDASTPAAAVEAEASAAGSCLQGAEAVAATGAAYVQPAATPEPSGPCCSTSSGSHWCSEEGAPEPGAACADGSNSNRRSHGLGAEAGPLSGRSDASAGAQAATAHGSALFLTWGSLEVRERHSGSTTARSGFEEPPHWHGANAPLGGRRISGIRQINSAALRDPSSSEQELLQLREQLEASQAQLCSTSAQLQQLQAAYSAQEDHLAKLLLQLEAAQPRLAHQAAAAEAEASAAAESAASLATAVTAAFSATAEEGCRSASESADNETCAAAGEVQNGARGADGDSSSSQGHVLQGVPVATASTSGLCGCSDAVEMPPSTEVSKLPRVSAAEGSMWHLTGLSSSALLQRHSLCEWGSQLAAPATDKPTSTAASGCEQLLLQLQAEAEAGLQQQQQQPEESPGLEEDPPTSSQPAPAQPALSSAAAAAVASQLLLAARAAAAQAAAAEAAQQQLAQELALQHELHELQQQELTVLKQRLASSGDEATRLGSLLQSKHQQLQQLHVRVHRQQQEKQELQRQLQQQQQQLQQIPPGSSSKARPVGYAAAAAAAGVTAAASGSSRPSGATVQVTSQGSSGGGQAPSATPAAAVSGNADTRGGCAGAVPSCRGSPSPVAGALRSTSPVRAAVLAAAGRDRGMAGHSIDELALRVLLDSSGDVVYAHAEEVRRLSRELATKEQCIAALQAANRLHKQQLQQLAQSAAQAGWQVTPEHLLCIADAPGSPPNGGSAAAGCSTAAAATMCAEAPGGAPPCQGGIKTSRPRAGSSPVSYKQRRSSPSAVTAAAAGTKHVVPLAGFMHVAERAAAAEQQAGGAAAAALGSSSGPLQQLKQQRRVQQAAQLVTPQKVDNKY